MVTPAVLALQDGTIFRGTSIGADGKTIGEVVFNTAMTGYQEILTDPSYCRQIVTLTYPHIGNTGTNSDDMESASTHASGLVIRDSSMVNSNWRSERSFGDFLRQSGTVAIGDLDTRKLTRIIREQGAQSGCIMTGDEDDPCLEPGIFMKRTIGRSGLVVVPQTGHTVNLEEPDLFNRVVLDFMLAVEADRWGEREPTGGVGFLANAEAQGSGR